MPTFRENKNFIDSLISQNLLDEAIDWIQSSMAPQEVFTKSQLEEWAIYNGFVKEE